MEKRTRIPLALAVALAAAVALIWVDKHLAFKSVGLIETGPWSGLSENSIYRHPIKPASLDTMKSVFHDETLFRVAMEDPAWKEHRKSPPDDYIAEWQKNVAVELDQHGSLLKITYTSNVPDARTIAPIAVSALIHAYERLTIKPEADTIQPRLGIWEAENRKLLDTIKTDGLKANQILSGLGSNPELALEKAYEFHFSTQRQIRDFEDEIRIERGNAVAPDSLAAKEKSLEDLKDKFNVGEKHLADLGHRLQQAQILRTESHRSEESQTSLSARIDELRQMQEIISTFKVIDYGSTARRVVHLH